MKRILLALSLIILLFVSALAEFSGSVGGGLGATMPQGEFNEYTKTGFSAMGFAKVQPFGLSDLGLRLGLQGVFFENEGRTVIIGGYPFPETYTNSLIKGTLGFEFSKRLNLLEPYGGVGLGIYYFVSKTELKDAEDHVLSSKILDSKTKFGWNLNGGLRIYIFPKVAFDFNIQYDIVQDLEQYRTLNHEEDPQKLEVISFNSKFLSLFAGVSIPFKLP